MKDAKALLTHLTVKKINDNLYEGESIDFGNPFVYGGQLLGQSLNAAYNEVVEGKFAHSLNAHFFKPGNHSLPIQYLVEKINESNTFSVQEVKAMQNNEIIYSCTISFKKNEKNLFEYQAKMPFIFFKPSFLFSQEKVADLFRNFIPKNALKFISIERPFHTKMVEFTRFLFKKKRFPKRNVWFKFKNSLRENFSNAQKQQMLLYLSDYGILFASLDPFPNISVNKIIMPTISHTIWFHREFSINDYLLFNYECTSATNSKSFTKGNFFSKNGDLIASAIQEGLMRIKSDK